MAPARNSANAMASDRLSSGAMSAAAVPASRDIRVICLIGAAHGASHYYQLAFATMLLIVRQEAGLSFTEIGVLTGIFYGVSGVTQTMAGFAVDRFGARPILAGGLFTIGVALALISVAHSFVGFAAIAVIAGLGNSVFHPADFALLNASVNPGRLGRAYSIHGVGGSLGWAAAPVMFFLDSMFGWVGAAMIGAIPGVALSVLVLMHRDQLVDHRVKDRAAGHHQQDGKAMLALFTQPAILLCLVYFALIAANTVGIQQFAVPAWVSMFGISENYAALCLIVFIVGSAGGVLVGGFFADRVRRHDRVATLGLLVAGARRRGRRRHRPVARHDRAQRHAARRLGQGVRLRLFRAGCRLVPGAAILRLADDLGLADAHLLDRRRPLRHQRRPGDGHPPEHRADRGHAPRRRGIAHDRNFRKAVIPSVA